MGQSEGNERGTRRSSQELRGLLLEAARREFAATGYPGTTTRDVARSAGVAHSALHRHFASKTELFAEAVLEPFVTACERLGNACLRQLAAPLSDEGMMEVFVRDMVTAVSDHSHALEKLMGGPTELSEATIARIRDVFNQLFAQMQVMTELEANRRGWFSPKHADDTLRVLMGMILGTTAFGWFLFPDGTDESRAAKARKAMVEIGLWGLARHAPTSSALADPEIKPPATQTPERPNPHRGDASSQVD